MHNYEIIAAPINIRNKIMKLQIPFRYVQFVHIDQYLLLQ